MAMDADVRLLIGVARGGADGDSEALIRKELYEIMGNIKLEANLDSKSFCEQSRKQLDAICKNGKFYVNLSKINIGAGAIADFRRQLNTVINTLNLDKGTSITLTAEGIGEVKSIGIFLGNQPVIAHPFDQTAVRQIFSGHRTQCFQIKVVRVNDSHIAYSTVYGQLMVRKACRELRA
mgnify:CR=1 FL=1